MATNVAFCLGWSCTWARTRWKVLPIMVLPNVYTLSFTYASCSPTALGLFLANASLKVASRPSAYLLSGMMMAAPKPTVVSMAKIGSSVLKRSASMQIASLRKASNSETSM